MAKLNREMGLSKGSILLSIGVALVLILLSASTPSVTQSQSNDATQGFHDKARIIRNQPEYEYCDSIEFSSPELAASAVTPFCRSFDFLCHIRCMQRGDPCNPNNVNINTIDGTHTVEINRCAHVPHTTTNRVLCMCNNGIDLSVEIDYAIEGVVGIAAVDGDKTDTGEAGKIREVAYVATKAVTTTETETEASTSTET
ncbi:hypothetical protein BGZ59_001241 [Podila verticillata]|nr:hypothetical protein BGZ59_001241 [Podila verticillata]